MPHRSRRDRERKLQEALDGSGTAGTPDDPERLEIERLASLAATLRRVGNATPTIDERRVWLQVRAGMLAEPQRRPGLWGQFGWLGMAPRLVVATTLGVLLFIGAAVSSLLFQPSGNASAAFIQRVDEIATASTSAAERTGISTEDRAAIEREAFALLELASRPGVLASLRSNELSAVRDRLIEARVALTSLLAEDPNEARAIAALSAISGLLELTAEAAPNAAVTSTLEPTVAPATVAPATVEPTAALVPATAAVQTSTAAAQVSPAPATSTPASQRTATAAPTATATPQLAAKTTTTTATAAAPAATASAVRSGAASNVQQLCSRVVDQASLAKCEEAAAQAQRECRGESALACRRSLEELADTAEERLERVRESCKGLPNSKTRDACSDATRSQRKISGLSSDADAAPGTSGSGAQQSGSHARGTGDRRD